MKLFSFSFSLSLWLSSRLNNCFSCFYVFVHQAHFCHFLHIRWTHIIREIREIRVQVKKFFLVLFLTIRLRKQCWNFAR